MLGVLNSYALSRLATETARLPIRNVNRHCGMARATPLGVVDFLSIVMAPLGGALRFEQIP
jgi:hypothetical protein